MVQMDSSVVSLAEKVVVVTGAGRGIGRAIALAMAAHGARVVVNDLGAAIDGGPGDAGCAAAVADEIRAAGGAAVAHAESVASAAGAERLIALALDTWGRIDAVVNNAGILRDRLFFKLSPDDWRAVIDVHLNGSFLVARAAATPFRAARAGAFVHMTSTSGLIGSVGQANYAAAKMGIVGLSRSLALDMARQGVRSNCIAPWANTRMIDAIPTDSAENRLTVQRMRTVDAAQVAPLAVFLASDAAAGVSGQIFGIRANEVFVFSQPRPQRLLHRAEGWTADSIATHAMPALRGELVALETSEDFFCWDPV
jgi:NAD(P)-dependent dehydrogenase (short-subunit alcohol dehydrogenase family)